MRTSKPLTRVQTHRTPRFLDGRRTEPERNGGVGLKTLKQEQVPRVAAHLKWLLHLTTENSPLEQHDRLVFREYHALLLYKLERRDELDRQIEELALLPNLAPMVGRLQCFRGISLHSAMVLATEIVDWRRFERPSQLACYLGLVSREDSSGGRTRLGSITKAGNSHCRHVLVQAAWSIGIDHRPGSSSSDDNRDRIQASSYMRGRRSNGYISASIIYRIANDPRSRPWRSLANSSVFCGP